METLHFAVLAFTLTFYTTGLVCCRHWGVGALITSRYKLNLKVVDSHYRNQLLDKIKLDTHPSQYWVQATPKNYTVPRSTNPLPSILSPAE